MVEAKGQQRPLAQTVDHTAHGAGLIDQLSHHGQSALHDRPDKCHQKAQGRASQQGDHGDKFRSRKDPQDRRQLDIVILVEKRK